MTPLDKLMKARELIMEVELQLIQYKGFCPYEIGFTLRKLDEAILQLRRDIS